eukprot:CAMPEP_0180185930 /NCGR_PEP_ID=MMETSP0986-20121125/42675_1 /TAXON_ID=697907 /ORGANISM="non described non described, Strain CCMP2293" /LENGTH=157 /DNA_ID=CAMNT_0022139825 /DNA_START=33 /DNA_END=503 /DNA_ORIENTATION=-
MAGTVTVLPEDCILSKSGQHTPPATLPYPLPHQIVPPRHGGLAGTFASALRPLAIPGDLAGELALALVGLAAAVKSARVSAVALGTSRPMLAALNARCLAAMAALLEAGTVQPAQMLHTDLVQDLVAEAWKERDGPPGTATPTQSPIALELRKAAIA